MQTRRKLFSMSCSVCNKAINVTEKDLIHGVYAANWDDVDVFYYRCPYCNEIHLISDVAVEYKNRIYNIKASEYINEEIKSRLLNKDLSQENLKLEIWKLDKEIYDLKRDLTIKKKTKHTLVKSLRRK